MSSESANSTLLLFDLTGLDCADCAARLEQGVAAMPQVATARADFALARLEVLPRAGSDPSAAIVRLARDLGYGAAPAGAAPTGAGERRSSGHLDVPAGAPVSGLRWPGSLRDAFTAVAGVLLAAAFLLESAGVPLLYSHTVYGLSILAGGFFVARAGLAALRATRSLDMNLLMTIAALGAALIGQWEEAALVVFLFSFGNALESYTMGRARSAIRGLMTLAPNVATLLHRSGEGEGSPGDLGRAAGPLPGAETVPVESLAIGDLILVRPGERVPMDGQVVRGQSWVDQSPVTGESVPVESGPGDALFAGSVNGTGALTVRVARMARDNTIARIIHMVERAQAQKAPSQRFVDTFARYYTPAVIVLAALVAVVPPLLGLGDLGSWFYRALVLLVISCPCALVISTPVSIVSAIASAARNGVLIKGGASLEAAGSLRAVAFDKTGTLTHGRPVVTDVLAFDGGALPDASGAGSAAESRLLLVAAAIEARSEHPLARAILDEARLRGLAFLPAQDLQSLPGQGVRATVDGRLLYVGNHLLFDSWRNHGGGVCSQVDALEAQGKTVMIVGDEAEALGLIAVADTLRPGSRDAVAALKSAGIGHTIMLTGDNPQVAQAIGRAVGVDEVRSGLLPEEKVAAVEELLARYGRVAMVGDGINDAPALARATVGMAMGVAGTDAALETADIALMSDDLSKLAYSVGLSRRAEGVIRQNIVLSLAIKGVFLALAVPGLATLWMAVFADMGASLIVTLNGMRLLRRS